MFDRYKNRKILLNQENMYDDLFKKRNVKFINQYNTPTFSYPDSNDLSRFTIIEHLWQTGDKYYKLAHKYYGDPRDWWVIAKFNARPTESHVKIGDIIFIPTPVSRVLNFLTG